MKLFEYLIKMTGLEEFAMDAEKITGTLDY